MMSLRPSISCAVMLLSIAACNDASGMATEASEVEPAEATAAATTEAGQVGRNADLKEIDPDPVPAAAPIIVSQETINVLGKPACAFVLRYPGHIDQDATWTPGPCDAVELSVISPAQLRSAGQLDDLPEEARRDIERMEQGVVVATGDFTASAYPLNVAGRVYEVVYAD